MIQFYDINDNVVAVADDNDTINDIITEEINGEMSMSFEIQKNSPLIKHLATNMLLKTDYNGQLYRINKIAKSKGDADNVKISALHVYNDAKKLFVPDFESHIGDVGSEIFRDIWDSPFDVLDDEYIEELGMIPEPMVTDFEERSHVTAYDLANDLVTQLCCGEIYVDNYSLALVREIGAGYDTIDLQLDKNINSYSIETDTSDIVTKLHVFGKDGLDLTSKLNKTFIVSENANIYGIKEGYLCWNEISDIDMLMAKANWQFDGTNQNRIDMPYVTITADYVDFSKQQIGVQPIHLGQSVTVGNYSDLRIIKIVHHPKNPIQKELTIGKVKKDLFYFLKKFNKASNAYFLQTQNLKGNTTVYNTIVEVTKQEVLAADIIEAGAVFATDIFTERLETNITSYLCLPNLVANGTDVSWKDESHSWHCTNTAAVRGYIKLQEMSQQFIEAHLKTADDYSSLGSNDIQALTVNNKQVYFTSIQGGENAYQYFTFVNPKTKYPNMSDENAEMFKAYVRKVESEYIKMQQKFEWDADNSTYNVITTYGVGDVTGNGVYAFVKDSNNGRLIYSSRTDGKVRGIAIDDEGVNIVRDNIAMRALGIRRITNTSEMEGSEWDVGDVGYLLM